MTRRLRGLFFYLSMKVINVCFKHQKHDPNTYFGTHNENGYICSHHELLIIMYEWKKVLKNVKMLGIKRNECGSNPQIVEREWIFSGKYNLNYSMLGTSLWNIAITKSFAFSIFHLIKSCDIQTLDKEIWKWMWKLIILREEFLILIIDNENPHHQKHKY